MSRADRRVAKARPVGNQLEAAFKNPVINEDDPTAFLDVVEAKVTELQKVLQPAKRGRKSPKIKRVRSTRDPALRNRAEGTKWIETEMRRRARKAGGQRVPKKRDKKLVLLKPIVDEANRMLPDLRWPYTVDEFLPPQHSDG
jgi:hypothetical protein